MALWEDNIFGMVRKEDWLAVGNQIPTRQADPIDGLFGDEKTDNLVAKWESIAAEYSVPMMAQFHGFDTESQTTFRLPIDTHNIEKGLIKVKLNQSERLRALAQAGVTGDQALYDYVLDDGIRLADQVITRSKVAKNELMATGKVTIKENNLNLTVDYGVPSSQTSYVFDLSEGADVPSQIQELIDDASDKGVIITGLMTSRKNLTKMRKNTAIQKAINGNTGVGALVSNDALMAYLDTEFGISTVVTNDLTYGASAEVDSDGRPVIANKKYYPQNKMTFFAGNANGRLGTGLWGDSPEATAAKAGFAEKNIEASTISPYVYIMQWMENDPTVTWTKASSLFIPVLYNPNSLWIATIDDSNFLADLTVSADDADATYPWTDKKPSDFQSNVSVSNGKVTGTLKFIEGGLSPAGPLSGDGYFLALKWNAPDPKATSLLVSLVNGHMSPQEAIDDPDRDVVFKIEGNNQKPKFVQSDGFNLNQQIFDLDLTFEDSEGV